MSKHMALLLWMVWLCSALLTHSCEGSPLASPEFAVPFLLDPYALGGQKPHPREALSSPTLNRAEEPIVLPPIVGEEGLEVALLLVPGAYINGAAYGPLGAAVQQASSLRLWVGLVRPFALDLPNPVQAAADIDLTIQMMLDQGMKANTSTFIGGHSLGGVVMQEWVLSHQSTVTGVLLLASELSSSELASSAEPVLQLSGDLDGLVRVPEVEPVFRELEAAVAEDPNEVLRRPVVILTDINHMHFASGDPPPAVVNNDILSPLSEADGQALLAEHINAFMTVTLQQPAQELEQARAMLQRDYRDTREILRPLLEMRELTAYAGSSPWAIVGQQILSNLDPEDYNRILVNDTMYEDQDLLEAMQPVVELNEEEMAVVNTYSMLTFSIIVEIHLSPQEIAIKFKNEAAIQEVLGPLGVGQLNKTVSCVDVNKAAIAAALSSCSSVVNERYASRSRPIILVEDDAQDSGPQWLESKIIYNNTDRGLLVQSSSLTTGLGVPFGFDGMYYCKLLPPSRALEYIMVDSLAGTAPAAAAVASGISYLDTARRTVHDVAGDLVNGFDSVLHEAGEALRSVGGIFKNSDNSISKQRKKHEGDFGSLEGRERNGDDTEEGEELKAESHDEDGPASRKHERWFTRFNSNAMHLIKENNLHRKPEIVNKAEKSLSEAIAGSVTDNSEMKGELSNILSLILPKGLIANLVAKVGTGSAQVMDRVSWNENLFWGGDHDNDPDKEKDHEREDGDQSDGRRFSRGFQESFEEEARRDGEEMPTMDDIDEEDPDKSSSKKQDEEREMDEESDDQDEVDGKKEGNKDSKTNTGYLNLFSNYIQNIF